MNKWILTNDRLPREDIWVLGLIKDYGFGPNVAVVQIEKGITIKEREGLCAEKNERGFLYRLGDEDENNLVPYAWDTWGPKQYFGQEIIAWMPLPDAADLA